jgi:hypothetical protein
VGSFRCGMEEAKVNVSRFKQYPQIAERLAGAL